MSLELSAGPVLEPGQRSSENPRMSDPAFKSEFLRVMRDRGYIHQISHPEELDEAARRFDWDGFPTRRAAAAARGRKRGLGIAYYMEATGGGPS